MKFVLIGKCFSDEINGPGQVMLALKNVLDQRYSMDSCVIFWNERNNKISFLWSVVKQLASKEGCLINVHESGLIIPTIVMILSKLFPRHAYYLTMHGVYEIEAPYTGGKKWRYALLEKLLCCHFPNIICVSDLQRKTLGDIYGRRNNALVIPNGTAAVDYPISDVLPDYAGCLEMVSLGGIKERKGIKQTLNLMQFLTQRKRMNVHLSIYGTEKGNYTEEWLQKVCKEKNLTKNVSYCGVIQDKDRVYDIVSNAHFHLSLSEYDTFNIAIAESLVLGCPCICTDRCGSSSYVHDGENGVIVSLDSEDMNEDIYNYMCSFLVDQGKRHRITASTEEYRKLFSWEEICTEYMELRNESLGEK